MNIDDDTRCFDLESDVLMANGRSKKLKNIKLGDELRVFDFESSLGAVAATLGNIGPGLGAVGPGDAQNFAQIPDGGKWFLSFLMLLGRLVLFTVLMLFSPFFWRDN